MIDPQLALAQAIAHARSQQIIQPFPTANNPHAIHQMAASLAQRIAGSRAPVGQATVGMFPQQPQPQQHFVLPQPSVGYAPNGNPQDYVPSGSDANGDNGFFVRPAFSYFHPGNILQPGRASGY